MSACETVGGVRGPWPLRAADTKKLGTGQARMLELGEQLNEQAVSTIRARRSTHAYPRSGQRGHAVLLDESFGESPKDSRETLKVIACGWVVPRKPTS